MNVPEFKTYYPTIYEMDNTQREFYHLVEQSLSKGEYIDVKGNISYLFVFVYTLLAKWGISGFEKLSDYLMYLSELYNEEKGFSSACLNWAYDCLLALKRYDDYLIATEPNIVFGTSTHFSNLRLNIQKTIGLEANPIDILLMVGGRKTKFITENQASYKENLIEVFDNYTTKNGEWFKSFDLWNIEKRTYTESLFQGAPIVKNPELPFKIYSFYTIKECIEIVKRLSIDAENNTRKQMGVPEVGEGWISETQLFRQIEAEFYYTKVIQHGQPEWLGRQHFDVWIPNWKIAVEYQGKQHYEPVDYFGGLKAFAETQKRDKRKVNLAKRHGVSLITVDESDETKVVLEKIKNIIKNRQLEAPKS